MVLQFVRVQDNSALHVDRLDDEIEGVGSAGKEFDGLTVPVVNVGREWWRLISGMAIDGPQVPCASDAARRRGVYARGERDDSDYKNGAKNLSGFL